jgi:hypothetical protein
LDLPRLQSLLKHWRANPPAHVQLGNIAAGLGTWKAPAPEAASAPSGADVPFDFLQAALAAGGVFTGTTPDPTNG